MKTKGYWVIKFSNGWYFCGNNQFDSQLRKAQIYVWKEKAEEQAEDLLKRKQYGNLIIPAGTTYEIVGIDIREVKGALAERLREASWNYIEVDECYSCSNCGYSALNDYKGSSVASKFCPHCGKYMTNHQMEED